MSSWKAFQDMIAAADRAMSRLILPASLTRTPTEIEKVEAALARYRVQIAAWDEEWAQERMPCCPSCAFASVGYGELCDKIERVEKWLAILKSRKVAPPNSDGES